MRSNIAEILAERPWLRVRGEQHGRSRLTARQVLRIRAAWSRGRVTQKELARAYGVHTKAIEKIVRGITWRHLLPGWDESEAA